MEPVVGILRRGAPAVSITGLSKEEVGALQGAAALPDARVSLVLRDSPAGTGAVVAASPDDLRRFLSRLTSFHPALAALGRKIQSFLDNSFRSDYKLKCRGVVLDLGSRTHIMGILNVTPDSFSDGGSFLDPKQALERAREMADQGVDIIDIGGESTRPGADSVPEDEELRRVLPVIERLAGELSVPLSIDTYKSAVARKALQAGASIVNDISGLRFSPDMARVAAASGAAVVIMHIRGTPRDMQKDPVYGDVVRDVAAALAEGIELALQAGVDPEQVLIDPGIGFGKTFEHNLTLLDRLDELQALGRPILLGTSRKRFIGDALGISDPALRREGTAATVALGIERGARVIRVHDVAEMARVARMTDAILKQARNENY
jgi:dihydropteroate synthase